MTQEDKELLYKDLCARLPYNVRCKLVFHDTTFAATLSEISQYIAWLNISGTTIIRDIAIEDVRPYLFPLSSMTEEQKEEVNNNFNMPVDTDGYVKYCSSFEKICNYFNYLNFHHFDYRGLIGKGLAIDCTNLNIY